MASSQDLLLQEERMRGWVFFFSTDAIAEETRILAQDTMC